MASKKKGGLTAAGLVILVLAGSAINPELGAAIAELGPMIGVQLVSPVEFIPDFIGLMNSLDGLAGGVFGFFAVVLAGTALEKIF